VGALHLEDQEFPKRCGHYDDKTLVSAEEMAQKLRAARDAAGDALVLIARTDAIAVEGLDAAIARSQRYAEAGADLLFIEAPTSVQQIEEIARRVPQPKLINMFEGGKTPLLPAARLAELGYRVVIVPSDLQRAAIHAMNSTLAAIRRDGDSHAVRDRMVSFAEREGVIDTEAYLELDRRYGV
jgi:2-methylisocitrate lyase-like PEP mutase family enzyme